MTTRRNFVLLPAATLLCGRRPPSGDPRPEPLPATRLVFGGDVMLSRFVGRLARSQRDPTWPFQALAPYLAGADIAFLNLESPFSDRGRPVQGAQPKGLPQVGQGDSQVVGVSSAVELVRVGGRAGDDHPQDVGVDQVPQVLNVPGLEPGLGVGQGVREHLPDHFPHLADDAPTIPLVDAVAVLRHRQGRGQAGLVQELPEPTKSGR